MVVGVIDITPVFCRYVKLNAEKLIGYSRKISKKFETWCIMEFMDNFHFAKTFRGIYFEE